MRKIRAAIAGTVCETRDTRVSEPWATIRVVTETTGATAGTDGREIRQLTGCDAASVRPGAHRERRDGHIRAVGERWIRSRFEATKHDPTMNRHDSPVGGIRRLTN